MQPPRSSHGRKARPPIPMTGQEMSSAAALHIGPKGASEVGLSRVRPFHLAFAREVACPNFPAKVALGVEARLIFGRNNECFQAIGDLLAVPSVTFAAHLPAAGHHANGASAAGASALRMDEPLRRRQCRRLLGHRDDPGASSSAGDLADFIGGAQVGANYQAGRVVNAIEVMWRDGGRSE